MQSLSVRKYFELEEDRLKDFLKREELWAKEKKAAEELKKKTVSCGLWLQREKQVFPYSGPVEHRHEFVYGGLLVWILLEILDRLSAWWLLSQPSIFAVKVALNETLCPQLHANLTGIGEQLAQLKV